MVFDSKDSIIKFLDSHSSRGDLSIALAAENRLQFHSEKTTNPNTEGLNVFKDYLKSKYNRKAYERIINYFIFPNPTTELLDSVFKEHFRVFDAQDKRLELKLKKGYDNEYPEIVLNALKTQAWECYKHSPNSFLYLDTNEEKEIEIKTAPLHCVKAVKMKDATRVKAIAIVTDYSDNEYLLIDSLRYYTFKREGNELKDYVEHEPHNLGYAPVYPVISENQKFNNNIIKASPIIANLTNLDKLLEKVLQADYQQDYAGLIRMYALKSNKATEDEYDLDVTHYDSAEVGRIKETNEENDKDFVSPGGIFIYERPDQLQNPPVGMVSIDVDSLEFHVAEIQRRWNEIYTSLVGFESRQNEESKNELQVKSGFESKQSVHNGVKENFERLGLDITTDIAKIRFGASFEFVVFELGREVYVQDKTEVQDTYFKTIATNTVQSDKIRSFGQMLESEYRNNPRERRRQLILAVCEPYPFMDVPDTASEEEKIIKKNYYVYTIKFEESNMNLGLMSSESELGLIQTIEKFKSKLLEYATSERTRETSLSLPDSGNSDNSTQTAAN